MAKYFNKNKILSVLCALTMITSIGTPLIQIASAERDSYCDYACFKKAEEERLAREKEARIQAYQKQLSTVISNAEYANSTETKSTLRQAAELAEQYGMKYATDFLGKQMSSIAAKELASSVAQNATSQAVSSSLEHATDGALTQSPNANSATNASNGLSPAASMALQAVLGVIGGIPLSQSVQYSPSGSKGTYVCAPMDSNSLNPGVNDNLRYMCTGVPFAGNTVIVPPVQIIEMNPKEGGMASKSIQGATITYHYDWVEFGSCGASLSANVYDGGTTMGGDIYGSFSDFEQMIKDIEALGADGEAYLREMGNYNFDSSYLDYKDTNSSLSDAIYHSENRDFSDYSGDYNSGNYGSGDYGSGDYGSGDYSSGTLNDMYGDSDSSFNSGGSDWSSSNSDGNMEGIDTDQYFNSSNNYSIEGMNIGNLTDDILGVGGSEFSSFNSGNNLGGTDGIDGGVDGTVSDLAGISTTNADGVPGYYDNNGNFIPYDQNAYDKFQAINTERIRNGQDPLSWAEFMQQYYGAKGFDNDGQYSNKGSSLSSTLDILKDKVASIFGGEKVATMTEQQMFDAAKKFLLANGYSLDELIKGANYDAGSVYTEPQYAWDMNRITKLLKLNKIEITDENDKPVQPQNSALGKATMTGSGFLKADQEQRKVNK